MMKLSRDFYFFTLSAMLLAASHFYSLSVNRYQITIHLLSIFFIYITIIKVSDADKAKRKPKGCGKRKSKTVVQCLQNQCHKAATSDECNKYARCQWNNNSCMTKQILCENLDKTACNTKDCQWNNRNNRCFWKQRAPEGEHDILYDAEKHGLNAKCFKSSEPPDMKIISLNDFVNDSVYMKCISDCSDDKCIDRCKLDSARRSKCEASDGFKFDMKRKTCDKFYSIADVEADKVEADVVAHDHDANIVGYKRANLFQMSKDHLLVYFFKALLLLITVLVNINVIIFLKNYKNS